MKKGQFALEFVILVSFTILFSAVLLVVIQKSYAEAQRVQQEEQVSQIMRIISSEVNLAEISPPGYVRTFYVPSLIDGQEYNLSSADDVDVVFYYNDQRYVFFLPSVTLKGACSCLKPGFNTIRKECPQNSMCSISLVDSSGSNCLFYRPDAFVGDNDCDNMN